MTIIDFKSRFNVTVPKICTQTDGSVRFTFQHFSVKNCVVRLLSILQYHVGLSFNVYRTRSAYCVHFFKFLDVQLKFSSSYCFTSNKSLQQKLLIFVTVDCVLHYCDGSIYHL